jgi:hypothetical protein
MKITNTIQLGLLVAAGVLLGWGMRQHAKQARELASVQAQAETQRRELESRQQALQALEQRNGELEQAERRAGNQTLLALLRERNAATLAFGPAPKAPESRRASAAPWPGPSTARSGPTRTPAAPRYGPTCTSSLNA